MKGFKQVISSGLVMATLLSSSVVVNAETEIVSSTEVGTEISLEASLENESSVTEIDTEIDTETNANGEISKAFVTELNDIFLVYEDGSVWKNKWDTGEYREILKDKKSKVKTIVTSSTWSNVALVLLEDGTLMLYQDNSNGYEDDYTQVLASGIKDVYYKDHYNFVITNDNKLLFMEFEDLENSEVKFKKITKSIMGDVKSVEDEEGQDFLIIKTNGDLLKFNYTGNGAYTNELCVAKNYTKILTNVKDVEIERSYHFVLKNDGKLYYYEDYGDIKDYNKSLKLICSGVKEIVAKEDAIYFIKDDNTLWVGGSDYKFYDSDYWGDDAGIEAMKTKGFRKLEDNVASISANDYVTLVVKKDGTLLGMGDNSNKEITTKKQNISSEFDENGFYTIMTDVKDFNIRNHTTIAVTQSGDLYGFGENYEGTLVNDEKITEISEPLKVDTDVKWADNESFALFYTKGSNYSLKKPKIYGTKYVANNVKIAKSCDVYGSELDNTYFYLTNDNKLFKVENDVAVKLADNIIDFIVYDDYIGAINTNHVLVFDSIYNTTTYSSKDFKAKFEKDAKFRASISYWSVGADYTKTTVYTKKNTMNFKATDIKDVADINDDKTLKMTNGDVYRYVKNANMFGEKRTSYKDAFEKIENCKVFDRSTFTLYYVDNNDVLWGEGDNEYGQIGDISQRSFEEPVKIMEDVKDIRASNSCILILKTDGTLVGRGANIYGELGFKGQGYAFTNEMIVDLVEVEVIKSLD